MKGMILSLPLLLLVLSPGVDQEQSRPFQARSGMTAKEARAVQRAAARHFGLPETLTLELADGVELELILIPPGEFLMGDGDSPDATAERWPGTPVSRFAIEHPQHRVTISRPFFVGRHEVTWRQWRALMGGGAPAPEPPDHPVVHITWDAAREFTERLSEVAGREVRMLTEAEWEFSARAGTTTEFSFGDDFDPELANCRGEGTVPVGSYPANPWGLHDVHGNAVEWVMDGYGFYTEEDQTDPPGPEHIGRMLRGGDYTDREWGCRSAYRYAHHPAYGDQVSGLRVVVPVPPAG
jgi:formylglycine-generating enzyme required for sulfatase activity